jgi:two-component system response regulator (stage 0 sporulation protein A)
MKMKRNEKKLDQILLELGHDDFNVGTRYLRIAAMVWDGGPLTKELYPTLARVYGSTPSRVERNIRHSIEKAWYRADWEIQAKYFGSSVNPRTGKPTNGEYIARLARLIEVDED